MKSPLHRFLNKSFKLTGIALLISVLCLVGCQSKLIYFPRPYDSVTIPRWKAESGHRVIEYRTSSGVQHAFLISRTNHPRHLWIVCGGNGTVALDWSDWIEAHAPAEDAWLLFDMPGYGASEGKPSPWSIRSSLRAVVPEASKALGWSEPDTQSRLRFFGHSLGSAVTLVAADEFQIQRGVIVAPFTSTMDMTRQVLGVPLGFLVWHRFDNEAQLAKIELRGEAKVVLFHGSADEVIPVTMSQKLSREFPKTVHYQEIPEGHHNNLQDIATEALSKALRDIDQ